jgi:ATP adenylyltransferase/5',5'''-P-1,P-4-tetraphosphate phosphorylase II
LGAPRAFFTPVIREIGFPNVSYGEDYAVGLGISRNYRIGRIYDVLYLCRRWGGNSDAALSHEKVNAHNLYKDSLRTAELEARLELVKSFAVPSADELKSFFDSQLVAWPDAAVRYQALAGVELRPLGNGISLQYNPARMVSTGAKVDTASVTARPCFLCPENRPAEQSAADAMSSLEVLVNPYPILPYHFTIPTKLHTAQLLEPMYADMLHIARKWQGMALFYNGAKCGASAPDHAHLQAVRASDVPLLGDEWSEQIACGMEPLCTIEGSFIYSVDTYIVPLFMVVAKSVSHSVELMSRLMSALPCVDGEPEPRMNIITYFKPDEGYVTIILPRSAHRPLAYSATGDAQRLVSPGTLDMAGLMITPRECDFNAITADDAAAMLREVAIAPDVVNEIVDRL